MRQAIDNVVGDIERELKDAAAMVMGNSATTSNPTGTFDTGPAVTKHSPLENNEKSIKYLFDKVNSKLYKKAMPVLNEASIRVSSAREQIEIDEKGIDSIKETVQQDFETAMTLDEASYVQKKVAEETFAKKKYDQAKEIYDRLHSEYQETARRVKRYIPVIKFKSNIAYYALLIFIGICEIPLNKVIFQRFGESDNITLIMAGTLAIAVPVLAHFIGLFWRQRSEMKEYFWKAIALTFFFLATNFGLGVFRADVLTEIISMSGVEVTQEKLYLNIGIFVGITTILFIIGVIAAYLRHDPSYSLEHTYNQWQKEKVIYEAARDELRVAENKVKEDIHNYQLGLSERYDAKVNNILNIPKQTIEKRDLYIADYEYVLEKARGLEKLIQSEYAFTASALKMDYQELPKPFTGVKEFTTIH